jgi:hypothetical protein
MLSLTLSRVDHYVRMAVAFRGQQEHPAAERAAVLLAH